MKNSIKDFLQDKTSKLNKKGILKNPKVLFNKKIKDEKISFNESEKMKDAFNENSSKVKKINIEKIKECALLVTAVALIGVGYVNFSKNTQIVNNTIETFADSTNSLGDVQLVNSNATLVDNGDENSNSNLVENDDATVDDSGNTITTASESENTNTNQNSETNSNDETSKGNEEESSNTTNSNKQYFSELRMSRDNNFSQSLETYQKIVDSSSISSEQKAIAIQEIENINKIQSSITVAEELIKLKGFEDVVIYENDGSVSVIVRVAALSDSQVAQIQNIVSRELGADAKNINISNK